MEFNFTKNGNFLAESGEALKQAERFAVIDAEFLTAGILLEVEGTEWWTPSQAGDRVRKLRAEQGIFEDSDIRSGVGYTAIAHLRNEGKIEEKSLETNPGIQIYHVIPHKTNLPER
jgi:hypothetical protein